MQTHAVSVEDEVVVVLTHGILHLVGYDHHTQEDKQIMMVCG